MGFLSPELLTLGLREFPFLLYPPLVLGPRSSPRSISWASPAILRASNSAVCLLRAPKPMPAAQIWSHLAPACPLPTPATRALLGLYCSGLKTGFFPIWKVCSPLLSPVLPLLEVRSQRPPLPPELCDGISSSSPELFQCSCYPLSLPTGCSL